MNSFFQTVMHPDDIHLTAVMTLFKLYEWLVMPIGLKNAPAIHQQRVTAALCPWIGKIYHIYLDDIIVWSNSIEEHIKNVETILTALKEACLYCNLTCFKQKLISWDTTSPHAVLKQMGRRWHIS